MGDWKFPGHYTEQACKYHQKIRAAEIDIFIREALPVLREACRTHGYTLALHGSQKRDLDLVAIPWADEVSDVDTVITSLVEATKRATGWGHLTNSGKREQKPHGRIAIMILASAEVHLDISIFGGNSTNV